MHWRLAALLALLTACSGCSRPSLNRDFPPVVRIVDRDDDGLPVEERAPTGHVLDARAVPEKQADTPLEGCDYPGPFVPCWCATMGLPTSCTADEYAESVQLFGPPRFFVTVE